MQTIKAIIFDWGDTLMRVFPQYEGPMAEWPQVELLHGADEALAELSERFVCCVASNADDSDAELMGRALERVGIRRHFRQLWTSKELKAGKPHQDFFRRIVQRLGLQPQECIMVGDDYRKDIMPAKSISMRTIWYTGTTRTDTAPHADEVIDSMADLPDAVMRMAEDVEVAARGRGR